MSRQEPKQGCFWSGVVDQFPFSTATEEQCEFDRTFLPLAFPLGNADSDTQSPSHFSEFKHGSMT